MAGGWSHGYNIDQVDYKLNKDYSIIKIKTNPFLSLTNFIKTLLNKLIIFYPFFLKIRYLKNKFQSNFPKEET